MKKLYTPLWVSYHISGGQVSPQTLNGARQKAEVCLLFGADLEVTIMLGVPKVVRITSYIIPQFTTT